MKLNEVEALGAEMYILYAAVEELCKRFEKELVPHSHRFKQQQKRNFNELSRLMHRANSLLSEITEETYYWGGKLEGNDSATPMEVADELCIEAADTARTFLHWQNAIYHDPKNVLVLESTLKNMSKKELVPKDFIESIRYK